MVANEGMAAFVLTLLNEIMVSMTKVLLLHLLNAFRFRLSRAMLCHSAIPCEVVE